MKFLALAACASLLTPLALAGTITVTYSGLVDFSNVPNIPVGSPFSGSFTYNLPGIGFVYPGSAAYRLIRPGDGLILTAAGYTFYAGPSFGLNMSLEIDPAFVPAPNTTYMGVGENISQSTGIFATDYPGLSFSQIDTQLIGNLNFLQSTAIPNPFRTTDVLLGLVPFPSGFIESAVSITFTDPSQNPVYHSFSGGIQTIQATAETPEPESSLLAGAGLVLLCAKLIRRR